MSQVQTVAQVMLMIIMTLIMATYENEFELRLGKPPADSAPKLKGVRSAVRQARRAPRTSGPKARQTGVRAHFAKGSASRARPAHVASRRVVVKVRYAANGGGKSAPLRAHVRYLARESAQQSRPGAEVEEERSDPTRTVDYLTREDGGGTERFAFYDRASSEIDARAVTAGWSGDPRHFRMIVSAEDGAALGDLKPFIREVMAGLEARLGTQLDWIAVDHHDTDNPHTHVLIRGRRPDGQDLFIPSRMISSGIREHAQEIVTRVLGPRLDVDLARERFREITQVGLTALDRELLTMNRDGALHPSRADLIGRLERLEGWGLAERSVTGWRLAGDLPARLKAMALHDHVVSEINLSQPDVGAHLILEAERDVPVIGELIHVGPADDASDRFLAVVETGAGELRYARFERPQDIAMLDGLEPGAIITFEPNAPTIRPSDEAVARIAGRNGGIYSQEAHVGLEPHVDRRLVAANIRRLENMRRLGLVQRFGDGEFIVGHEHLSTALAFEEKLVRRAPFSVQVGSYWALADQVQALGPTHLDHALNNTVAIPTGESRVAREYDQALQQRRLFLIEQGWMGPNEQAPSRQALARMARAELSAHARALSDELGIPVRAYEVRSVSGIYARRIDLAQGRMALIMGAREANLVPWRPALERFAGREVEGVMRGQTIAWSLARGHGLSLPPI